MTGTSRPVDPDNIDVKPDDVDVIQTITDFVVARPEVVVIGVFTLLLASVLKKPFVRGGIVIGGLIGLIVYVLATR